jgi:hypothetical protein
MTIEELLDKKTELTDLLRDINKKISQCEDGHIYIVVTRCFSSVYFDSFKNKYAVENYIADYNGDNGITDVYTDYNAYIEHNDSDFYTLEDFTEMLKDMKYYPNSLQKILSEYPQLNS